jgi:integrase/recombinase XerD
MSSIKHFQEYLIEKEKSLKTVEAYIRDIQQLFLYLKNNNILEIHNDTLKGYKDYLLHEKFLSATTVNRKLVAIHQYLSFNEISATTNIVKIQSQNFLENVLDKSEVDKMIEKAENRKDLRAVALFKTLLLTGTRISEALSLTINDIHKNSIEIVGKGNKRRMIFIPKSLNKVWLQYCRNGRQHTKSDYLFVTQKGRMTRETAYRIIRKYGELCDIPRDKCFCHSFRHLYCKRLGDNPNITIDVIADLAGHQDISVTRKYLRKSKSELLSIIEDLD